MNIIRNTGVVVNLLTGVVNSGPRIYLFIRPTVLISSA